MDVAGQQLVHLAQALDRTGDGLPVGQHAAEPTVVHVILAATLRGFCNIVSRGALGANEQHAATASGHVAHGFKGALKQRYGLLQVNNVHLVAHAKQVRRHARVPAARVMAEMDARFEQVTQ